MAHFSHDDLHSPSRLWRSLWIYGQYQLAGLALSGLSILSMIVADRSMPSREPKLALLYVVVLAVPVGVWGLVKAVRFYSAAARPAVEADIQAG
jgi:hypothetical protein